eukprot:1141440-Pelagomonas_calceolata.AAC.2
MQPAWEQNLWPKCFNCLGRVDAIKPLCLNVQCSVGTVPVAQTLEYSGPSCHKTILSICAMQAAWELNHVAQAPSITPQHLWEIAAMIKVGLRVFLQCAHAGHSGWF